jgi:lysyl-tRNA synthetase class I
VGPPNYSSLQQENKYYCLAWSHGRMVTEEVKSLCAILPLQYTHSTGHGQGNAWCGTQVQAGWKYHWGGARWSSLDPQL